MGVKVKVRRAGDRGVACVHEALGIAALVALMLTAFAMMLWFWYAEYAIPISKMMRAECMVLRAEQEIGHEVGFGREPLYRCVIL